MGLKDLFRIKEEKPDFDPLRDLELSRLRVGYFVDYDMKSWQVTDYNRYDFDGLKTDEWELTSGREKRYLERSEDDEVEWSLSKKIPIGAIENDVRTYIMDHDDPPSQIVYKNITYTLDESGPGYMYPGGSGAKKEFIYWELIDEAAEHFITIEQWGETDFEAAEGQYVKEYQFSGILPGERM